MNLAQVILNPTGRIRRSTYLVYSLAMSAVSMTIMLVAHNMVGQGKFLEDLASTWVSPLEPFHIIVIGLNLLTIWPQYCVTAKRWHDRNRPEVWAVLMILYYSVPIAVVSEYLHFSPSPTWVIVGSIVQIVVSLFVIVDLGFLDGTQGPNRFGPSPKGLGKDAIARAFD